MRYIWRIRSKKLLKLKPRDVNSEFLLMSDITIADKFGVSTY